MLTRVRARAPRASHRSGARRRGPASGGVERSAGAKPPEKQRHVSLQQLTPTAKLHYETASCTEKTLVTREALLADPRLVRMRGYAVDNEEIEKGLRCVGAPVWNYSGEVAAAVSVAGPAFRITRTRVPSIARAVMAMTRRLSAELGYRPSAKLEVRSGLSHLTTTNRRFDLTSKR